MMSANWQQCLMRLLSNVPIRYNIFVLTKDIPENLRSKLSKIDDTFRMSNNAEKKSRRRKLIPPIKREGMWWRLPIHGSIDSESYWCDSKNLPRDMRHYYTWLRP